MSSNWHIWVMSNNKHKEAVEYLMAVDGIEEIFYPMADKEFRSKKAKIVKKVPLYANYVFMNYVDDEDVITAIRNCKWITSYVGRCTKEEIDKIRTIRKIDPALGIKVGNSVQLTNGAFVGLPAYVVNINGDEITVGLTLFGAERLIKCRVNDVEVI